MVSDNGVFWGSFNNVWYYNVDINISFIKVFDNMFKIIIMLGYV